MAAPLIGRTVIDCSTVEHSHELDPLLDAVVKTRRAAEWLREFGYGEDAIAAFLGTGAAQQA